MPVAEHEHCQEQPSSGIQGACFLWFQRLADAIGSVRMRWFGLFGCTAPYRVLPPMLPAGKYFSGGHLEFVRGAEVCFVLGSGVAGRIQSANWHVESIFLPSPCLVPPCSRKMFATWVLPSAALVVQFHKVGHLNVPA